MTSIDLTLSQQETRVYLFDHHTTLQSDVSMSTTPQYKPEESEDDAIVRVAAFQSYWLLSGMEMQFPFRGYGQYPSIVNIPATIINRIDITAPFDIGNLSKLPNELIAAVCLDLDIKSCLHFRMVSRLSRALVSSLVQYRAIAEEASELFLEIIRTDAAEFIAFTQLYREMCLQSCQACGKTGGYIYLPHAIRCCQRCLEEISRFRTVTLASFSRTSKCSLKKMQQAGIRVLKTVKQQDWGHFTKLVNFEEATRAMNTDLSLDVGHGYRCINSYGGAPAMAAAILPFLDSATQNAYDTMSCRGCAVQCADVSRARWPAGATRSRGCDLGAWWTAASRVYLRSEFLVHFRGCCYAKKLWDESQEGRVTLAWPNKLFYDGIRQCDPRI